MRASLAILFFLFLSFIFHSEVVAQEKKKILVFSKTNGWRHNSIPAGIKSIEMIGDKIGREVIASEDSLVFNDDFLRNIGLVVFCNTTGNILNDSGQASFEKYINNGGGYVGIHSATDTEHGWPFYKELTAAQFKDHPKTQKAKVLVNHTCNHPAVAHYGDSFEKVDEWYNFKEPVPDYVNVILHVDEDSYEGKQMGIKKHPISWYHYYQGGRVFYTGMGHTSQTFTNPDFVKHLTEGMRWAINDTDIAFAKEWTPLLDEKLTNFTTWVGVPHTSVQNLEGYSKSDNVTNGSGTPLGFEKDPLKIYTTEVKDGEVILNISGEIYAALTTKQEYQNYHFKTQFKWNEKKYAPRLKALRDNGILYHCNGKQGAFWDVWMSGLEYQVQETDLGDFFSIGDGFAKMKTKKVKDKKGNTNFVYDPKGKEETIRWGKGYFSGRVMASVEKDKANGEWNTLEIITMGNKSIHIVNSKIVNVVDEALFDQQGRVISLTKGLIQIQSEGAACSYKNMQIKKIESLPKKYQKLF